MNKLTYDPTHPVYRLPGNDVELDTMDDVNEWPWWADMLLLIGFVLFVAAGVAIAILL